MFVLDGSGYFDQFVESFGKKEVEFVDKPVYLLNIEVFIDFFIAHEQRLHGKYMLGDQTTGREKR